jgi:hypothetical protein
MIPEHPTQNNVGIDGQTCDNRVQVVPLRRLIWVIALLLLGFSAVSYFHWKKDNAVIPPLESLDVIQANELGTDMANSLSKSSIEFTDSAGNRYQVDQVGSNEWVRIKEAIQGAEPVILRYGPWRTPLPNKKIFTVYQLEIGETIILPYSRITGSMMLVKQNSLILTLAPTVLIVGLTVLLCSRFVKIVKHTTIHKIL